MRSSKLMPAGSRKRSRAGCEVAWLVVSDRGSQPDGSLVAALVAE
jgi:hypothetical protein